MLLRKKDEKNCFQSFVLGADCFVAVYTSDPLVMTIGCHNSKPYVIDTHPIAPPAGNGNGNGLVLVGNNNTPEVWMSICVWLWQRLHHGGDSPTIFTCENNMLFSRVKICFRVKAHLVFHCCLYNKYIYFSTVAPFHHTLVKRTRKIYISF